MMDELELLKTDWQKNATIAYPKKSASDIYALLHKKSASIVKTLFYLSIAELVFWLIINIVPFFTSPEFSQNLKTIYPNNTLVVILYVITFGIIGVFIYLLYNSYKSISITDNAKQLMENILKTRRVIKYYVIYNLVFAGLTTVILFYYTLQNTPEFHDKISHSSTLHILTLVGCIALFTVLFIGVIWLFYKLLYGILLKRLNRNYKELKKLEL